MTNYEKLRRKPSFFRMLTGLSAGEFDTLVAELEPVWLARKAKRSARRKRHRKPGAGRKPKLLLTDRVLLTLLYYRTYVTQELVGYLFGVDKGTVSRVVQELGLCMAGVFRIPEKKVRIDPDDLEAVFVDATEQAGASAQAEAAAELLGEEEAPHGQAPGRRDAGAEGAG